MAKRKSSGGYFGLGHVLSIILAIIPITNIIFGIIIRVQKKNVFGVILNIILCVVFWIIDLVTIILHNRVEILA